VTLRTRLLATTLAVAVPLTVVLFLIAERTRHADMEASLDRMLAAELSTGLVARCEADGGLRPPGGRGGPRGPEGRGGRSRPSSPVELIPYTRDFAVAFLGPAGQDGPPFPEALKQDIARGDRAAGTFATGDGRGRQLAVRTHSAAGPCDILLLRMRPREGELRDQAIGLASILFIVIAAIWFAAGPTLARIRSLAAHVRQSAASRYDIAVPESGHDEVGALARAFNEAGRDVKAHLTEVEAREQTLREFVANTTHDIAMPLTVLQSHLASLEQGSDRANADGDSTHIRGAIRETHYLTSLLRNLAAASRLEGGVPVEPITLDLNLIVERVVERHRPLARAGNIELNAAVPATPTPVSADPTLVEQAISNLVDNAVRYNHAGGHVAVVLDCTPSEFSLTVEDDGPGVTPAELPLLATRRFRGDAARSRRPDGQGIGLAITAETIAACGWSLSFDSHMPSGLIATVRGPTRSTHS
jgi:signal transduction histidine kinase